VAPSRTAQGRYLANSRKSWLILLILFCNAQGLQLIDEPGKKWGLQARPRDDDTFLNVEKECLFLLMACVYLSSRAVAYVTGSVILVDGGLLVGRRADS